MTAMGAPSLYIHIPFCEVRCPYCHFYCFVNKDSGLPERYVRALRGEARAHRDAGWLVDGIPSIYIGGGTPSALEGEALETMCRWLAEELMPLAADDIEVTIEMNPESTDAARLACWTDAGVNRVSLGLQSMDDGILKFLGRWNTPQSNLRALDLVCAQVENVSADLITGTPGSTWATTLQTLEAYAAHPIQHVSAYLLEIHRATRFGRDVAAGRWTPQPDEQQSELYLRAGDWLAARGFGAYELSNYAQPGFESKHNSRYWERKPYLGLGASSHSFFGERRLWNLADASAYCERVEAGQLPLEDQEILGDHERHSEAILLGLRTAAGISLELCRGADSLLAAWRREGLVECSDTRLRATPRGWLVLDHLVSQLLRSHGVAAHGA
jgi:oxygen-independent coproporphyrinogen-3 oxidase